MCCKLLVISCTESRLPSSGEGLSDLGCSLRLDPERQKLPQVIYDEMESTMHSALE